MGKFLSHLLAHWMANTFIGWLTRRSTRTTTPPPPQVGIVLPPNQPATPGGGGAATPSPLSDIEWVDSPPAADLLDDIELSDV